MRICLSFLVLSLVVVGCGKPEPAQPVDENAASVADQPSPFIVLMDKARASFNEGDTDTAVDLLTEGLADPQLADRQPIIFRNLMELLLLENRVVDAQTNFIAMLHASPETAAQTFGMIPIHLKQKGDPAAYLSWTEQMTSMDLPETIAETAYAFFVDANIVADKTDQLEPLARESVKRFGGSGAVRVLARPLNELLDRGDVNLVRKVVAILSDNSDEDSRNFVLLMTMAITASEGEWENVLDQFKTHATSLPDTTVRMALRLIGKQAGDANRSDVIDALSDYVLTTLPPDSAACAEAISIYLASVIKSKDYDALVQRIDHLHSLGISKQLVGPIGKDFYSVMSHASPTSRKTLLSIVEQLMESSSPTESANLQGFLMDGAVLNEDYSLALKVLDAGFRADDVAWVAMARNKLGAHLALQEGRTDDAVSMFREFMKHVEGWTTTTTDPSTGITYTREMSLGFNAKRIGDIYRDVNRTTEAAAAYAEARAYFEEAQKTAKEGSKEAAYINEQLAEIP